MNTCLITNPFLSTALRGRRRTMTTKRKSRHSNHSSFTIGFLCVITSLMPILSIHTHTCNTYAKMLYTYTHKQQAHTHRNLHANTYSTHIQSHTQNRTHTHAMISQQGNFYLVNEPTRNSSNIFLKSDSIIFKLKKKEHID